MKDWMIRALKTFAQAFGGVLIPEIVIILSGTLPVDLNAWKALLIPTLCASLAAGISAVWNVILEHLKENPDE